MTWFKVDDSFYDHPKVFDAPDCALALWVRAGCWSARNLTDGFVPANLPVRLCDDPDTAVRELVDRGLWKRTKGGYQFHDWTQYQPTGDEVRNLRSKRAEAGRKGGQAKAAKQTASKPVANAREVAKQNAAPSRPVPSRRDGDGEGNQSVRARENEATRWLRQKYGLTDDEAGQVITHVHERAAKPIKNPVPYLQAMAEGHLADIVAAVTATQQAPDPPPVHAAANATGCDRHPEGAVDPVPPEGWGSCLLCNTYRRRAAKGIPA